jgi:hypothetical protein
MGDQHIETGLKAKKVRDTAAFLADLETQFREKYSQQNETLAKHFPDLAKEEFVLDHYACSHLGNLLKPGRLFITPRYILFYANILGSKTKKKVPFEKILEIRKESNAFVVSPIEIHLKFKRFTFASFVYREQCYQHLLLQWKSNKEGAPMDIKIPVNEVNEEDDEGENASLQSQAEPMAELQSVWGTGDNSNTNVGGSDAILEGAAPPPPKKQVCTARITQLVIIN